MPTLTVRLFGPPKIELDGVVVRPDHRKPLALLAYLAISAKPHSREALATLLWPDYPNARAYLRNSSVDHSPSAWRWTRPMDSHRTPDD